MAMERFEPVTADNILDTVSYFAAASGRICDDTAGVTYQWRKLFDTSLLMKNGCLVTRSTFAQAGECYSFPVGKGDPASLMPFLREDAMLRGIPLRFACVTEERVALLKEYFGEGLLIEEKRNWADYLYEPAAFAYAGKKYHTQKNHVNRFYHDHPEARLEPVTDENAEEVSAFLDHILSVKTDMPEWERGEVEGTRDLLFMRKELNQLAAFLRVESGIVAFAMGEIRGDTLHVHAEKADTAFSGAYPAMAQAFSAYAAKNVTYINREDDAGDPGIRYSKEQYKPVCLIPKFLVTVEGK